MISTHVSRQLRFMKPRIELHLALENAQQFCENLLSAINLSKEVSTYKMNKPTKLSMGLSFPIQTSISSSSGVTNLILTNLFHNHVIERFIKLFHSLGNHQQSVTLPCPYLSIQLNSPYRLLPLYVSQVNPEIVMSSYPDAFRLPHVMN